MKRRAFGVSGFPCTVPWCSISFAFAGLGDVCFHLLGMTTF